MKRGYSVAIAGICSAVSMISVALSCYIPMLTLAFMAISVLMLVFLLGQKLRFSAILCFVSTSLLLFFLTNALKTAFPYIALFGGYTLLAYYLNLLPKRMLALVIILKGLYYNLLMYLGFFMFAYLTIPSISSFIHDSTFAYILVAAAGTVILFIYDYILRLSYGYVKTYSKKYFKGIKYDDQIPPTPPHDDIEN